MGKRGRRCSEVRGWVNLKLVLCRRLRVTMRVSRDRTGFLANLDTLRVHI